MYLQGDVFAPAFAIDKRVKLKLCPLSKISDEDAIEVANLEALNTRDLDLIKMAIDYRSVFNYKSHHFLVSKGYAVPLYFSPGHWANAKTAIELGIAIDSTKQL